VLEGAVVGAVGAGPLERGRLADTARAMIERRRTTATADTSTRRRCSLRRGLRALSGRWTRSRSRAEARALGWSAIGGETALERTRRLGAVSRIRTGPPGRPPDSRARRDASAIASSARGWGIGLGAPMTFSVPPGPRLFDDLISTAPALSVRVSLPIPKDRSANIPCARPRCVGQELAKRPRSRGDAIGATRKACSRGRCYHAPARAVGAVGSALA
jgi:hypothetical protein